MNKRKQKRSKVSYLENVTYWGKCSERTNAGDPCKNHVLFANGRCASHGGRTPRSRRAWTKEARAKFDETKERLLARYDRLTRKVEKKWRGLDKRHKASTKAGGSSPKITGKVAGPAKPSPEPAVKPAVRAKSNSAATVAYSADSTAAHPQGREQDSASSYPCKTSPAPKASPGELEHGKTLATTNTFPSQPSSAASSRPTPSAGEGEEGNGGEEAGPQGEESRVHAGAYRSVPPWHPAVVPGAAWSTYWRQQRAAPARQEPIYPHHSTVEPKAHGD